MGAQPTGAFLGICGCCTTPGSGGGGGGGGPSDPPPGWNDSAGWYHATHEAYHPKRGLSSVLVSGVPWIDDDGKRYKVARVSDGNGLISLVRYHVMPSQTVALYREEDKAHPSGNFSIEEEYSDGDFQDHVDLLFIGQGPDHCSSFGEGGASQSNLFKWSTGYFTTDYTGANGREYRVSEFSHPANGDSVCSGSSRLGITPPGGVALSPSGFLFTGVSSAANCQQLATNGSLLNASGEAIVRWKRSGISGMSDPLSALSTAEGQSYNFSFPTNHWPLFGGRWFPSSSVFDGRGAIEDCLGVTKTQAPGAMNTFSFYHVQTNNPAPEWDLQIGPPRNPSVDASTDSDPAVGVELSIWHEEPWIKIHIEQSLDAITWNELQAGSPQEPIEARHRFLNPAGIYYRWSYFDTGTTPGVLNYYRIRTWYHSGNESTGVIVSGKTV